MISWITKGVAIGDHTDARNVELLKREKIDCIFDLRRYHSGNIEVEIIEETEDLCAKVGCFPHHYHIEVGNFQGLEPIKIELRTAAYMLEQLTKTYKRILIHCVSGIDRAPFVVAWWMMNHTYDIVRLSHFYRLIKRNRPQIIEHYEWF